jgi:hypothetical protein
MTFHFTRHLYLFTFCLVLLICLQPSLAAADGEVSGSAWSSTIGWVNFGAQYGDVQVTDSSVTGQAWNANYGWINIAVL